MIKRYKALALQTECKAVNTCKTRDESYAIMQRSLVRILDEIRGSKGFIGPDLKLVVLPEYFLTSFPFGETLQQWKNKACLKTDDPLFDQIKAFCIANSIFVSGNFYELDDNFPDLYFQSSFIIDDEGQMILKYRRLNSMFAPTPHDIFDEYLKVYDYESLFPVADTKLGKLACIASEEILYPEVARCLVMRGAEVFLHSSSEAGSAQLSHKEVAKRARAIESMGYVVSSNSAGISGIKFPFASTDGLSKIVHFEGHVLSEALTGGSMVANSYIDIDALRDYRSKVSMQNYIARQRFELYAPSYTNITHYPPNSFKDQKLSKDLFIKTQAKVIQKLSKK